MVDASATWATTGRVRPTADFFSFQQVPSDNLPLVCSLLVDFLHFSQTLLLRLQIARWRFAQTAAGMRMM